MGAPLSMYQLLTQIQQNGHRLQLPSTLYAFVLYDKEQHPYIAAHIQENLVRYHQSTGKDVLFFVPHAEFPQRVLNNTQQYVERYLDPQEWGGEWGVLFNPYEPEHRISHSLNVSSVVSQLQLRADELPCVIVTPDLCADKFYVVPLSESRSVVYQSADEVMEQLTNSAFLLGARRVSFERLSQENQRWRVLLLERHSHDRMVDVLIAAQQITLEGENVVDKVNTLIDAYEKQCREYVRLMELSDLSQDERDIQIYEYEQNILREARMVWQYLRRVYEELQRANLIKYQQHQFPHARRLFNQTWDGMEPESLTYWRTAEQIIAAIENLHIDEDINYAPIINVLCQLIELEWNLSFVHMMRDMCGVRLPHAFAKVDAERGRCDIVSGLKTISFNKGVGPSGNQKWLPPGMGESRIVFETSLNNPTRLNPPIRVSDQIEELFGNDNQAQRNTMINNMLVVFRKIGDWRNTASHGGQQVITKDNFEEVCGLIHQLGAYITPLFVYTKMYYRGDEYKSIIDKSSNYHVLLRVFLRASDIEKREILTYALRSNKAVWRVFTIAWLPSADRDSFVQHWPYLSRSDLTHIFEVVENVVDNATRNTLIELACNVVRDYPITVLLRGLDSCVQFCHGRTWHEVQFWFPDLCAHATIKSGEFVARVLAVYDVDDARRIYLHLTEAMQVAVSNAIWRLFKKTGDANICGILPPDTLPHFITQHCTLRTNCTIRNQLKMREMLNHVLPTYDDVTRQKVHQSYISYVLQPFTEHVQHTSLITNAFVLFADMVPEHHMQAIQVSWQQQGIWRVFVAALADDDTLQVLYAMDDTLLRRQRAIAEGRRFFYKHQIHVDQAALIDAVRGVTP